ncbi:polysaccharide deacetylase [Desulfovibrio sp. X2]|uniref:polysaccharide deacetylase family protein n=1 Tax=Desulfovibrio sp. X2 TaxID=941449 RepID=UPI00035894D6|nr:polysaccharide deacetylase family protein [Desulfovibrio sp. X2]EPR43168.1 polysaccharide deacetylase [Desulfovibrio sp. X2]
MIHVLTSGRARAGLFLAAALFLLLCAGPAAPGALAAQPAKPKAAVALVVDDYPHMDVWLGLTKACDVYGLKATLALNTARVSPEDWKILAERVAKGHEIASHTRDHVPLVADDAVTVRYWRNGAKAAWASVAQGHLRFFVDNPAAPVLDLDLSQDGPTPDLRAVVDAVNRTPGFAAQLVNPYYAAIRSSFLAPAEHTDIFFKAGFAPLFVDPREVVRYELGESKRDIEANIPGYTCRDVIYPFLSNNRTTRTVARELGYECGRTGEQGNLVLAGGKPYDVFRIWADKPKSLFGPSTSAPDFAARVHAFLDKLKKEHAAGCIYSHGAEEYSPAEWAALLKVLTTDPEVEITTLHGLYEFVRASCALTADGTYVLKR